MNIQEARLIRRKAVRESGACRRSIGNVRRRLIREMKAIIEPHLWKSGFVERGAKGEKVGQLRIWCHKDKDGDPTRKFWTIGGYVAEHVYGVTEDGIIDDCDYMITTVPFACLPLEDLILLRRWVDKMFVTKEG